MNPFRALRTIEVEAPSWEGGKVVLREPTIRDWREAQKIPDDVERTISLLGAMVLDQSGKPVGREAMLDAPLPALRELATHIPAMLGETDESPLATPTDSTIN